MVRYYYYLYNILTDEMFEISANIDDLKQMIEFLIDYKYNTKRKISDQQFIEQNNNISNKYL